MRVLFMALLLIGFLSLIILVILQTKMDIYGFPSYWAIQYATHGQNRGRDSRIGSSLKLGIMEGFEASKENVENVKGLVEETTVQSGNPATVSSQTSYKLLSDFLPEKKSSGDLTAKTCYQTDFLAQTQKTGNYIQRTNNIRHGTPDSCSTPLTELVNSFYTNPTL